MDYEYINLDATTSVRIVQVLVVTRDGTVQAVQQDLRSNAKPGIELDVLWPTAIADELKSCLRRAIVARESVRHEAVDAEAGLSFEFVCVPQGRDRVMLITIDCTHRAMEENAMRRFGLFDTVTGLPNRAHVIRMLQKIVLVRRRQEGRAAVICFYLDSEEGDLERLTGGQTDQLIREISGRLERDLRGSNDHTHDAFDRMSLVARVDYRQFCVVLPEIEAGNDAESVAERLVGLLCVPVDLGGEMITLHTATGIGLFPQDGTDAETLLGNAQSAMDDARRSGTTSFRMHSGTVRLRALQRQDLSSELRSAVEREEFEVRYAPVTDCRDNSINSLQALLQWPENLRLSLSQDELSNLAIRVGVMPLISDWFVQEVCSHIRELCEIDSPVKDIAFRLSRHEFFDPVLQQKIASLSKASDFDPAHLIVQIRESTLDRDLFAGKQVAQSLKALGVTLAIDRFGSDRFSLSTLASGIIDSISIDPSLTRSAVSRRAVASLTAIQALAQAYSLPMGAVGVDTEDQKARLESLDICFMQGAMFGDVSDIEAIKTRLANTKASRWGTG